MRLLEYQAKQLFAAAGILTPEGSVADRPEQAEAFARALGGPVMVKAQVLAGGRGKAGGILRAEGHEAAGAVAARLLDSQIAGLPVRRVLVERALEIVRELYLGVTVDYDLARVVVLAGSQGGVEIEAQAEQPGVLARALIDPLLGLTDYVGRDLLRRAGVPRELVGAVLPILRALYGVSMASDGLLAEINPLVVTPVGAVIAADARLSIDDSALGRQPELARLAADAPDESIEERIKREEDFDFVIVDPAGEIGLVSTGAGGTMIALDLIQRAGGRPYNFADVRTGRLQGDPRRLIVVLRELAAAPNLKSVLVSVFGAITEMDDFARLLGQALDEVPLGVPIFVRVQGRKKAEAQAILGARGLPCFDELEAAVGAAVGAAGVMWRS